ncbi:MAG: hypothetical protein IT385_26740 [Deltaproteobacteria bacterium]|nr:hypothetical protein [Deltaproteobacteria bacterium]
MTRVLWSSILLCSLTACDAALDAPDDPTPTAPVVPATPAEASDDPLVAEAAEPVAVESRPDILVSRFGPTLGLAGTRVTVLVGFDARGCAARGECAVTIGGLDAPIEQDVGVLEALVPDGAATGPLCVTYRAWSQCAGDFTVLPAPLVYAVDLQARAPGDAHLVVTGAGFLPDAEVWLDWAPLGTVFVAEHRLEASLPEGVLESPGERSIFVYSPSTGRCGARSEPFTLTVE